MRRTCERSGCGQPVAVIYGQESVTPDGLQQFWIDSWSPDLAEALPPVGARGVLCAAHGEQLIPPRGWTLVDRRDAIPRLFKPRLVVDHRAATSNPTPQESRRRQGDRTAPVQRRISDVPRPQLFNEINSESEVDVDRLVDGKDDPDRLSKDPAKSLVDQKADRENEELDFEIDGLQNPSGSLLRDAFRRAHSGKRDATKELLRPTSAPTAQTVSADSDGL